MARQRNWSQVRKRTDSGKTGDKVNSPDPAAAPLGTDEEAGGARTSEEDIARAERERELKPEGQRDGSKGSPP